MPESIYQVCVLKSKRDFFNYTSHVLDLRPGTPVWVPFVNRLRFGIIISRDEQSAISNLKIKPIDSVISLEPVLSEPVFKLAQWIARYYQIPLSEVIPLALPKKIRLGQPITLANVTSYQLIYSLEKTLTHFSSRQKKQIELVHFLAQHHEFLAEPLILAAGFTKKQLKSLLDHELVTTVTEPDLDSFCSHHHSPALTPTKEQQQAIDCIISSLTSYQCYLLHGITGSGKTEVYLQVTQKLLAQEQQILVLVPEIGLTPQLLTRFRARFSVPIVVIHSHLNETERARAWQLARQNTAKIIIGTRAAVFSPLPHLGLIIVDEEHDSSFKQLDKVRYNARDAAIIRAKFANIPIILGSATPSLESLFNVQQQKYHLVRMSHKACAKYPLRYQLIDLRNQPLEEGIAAQSLTAISKHLAQNHQVLVFINRRGFAPIVLCSACGWIVDCKACDSHLTLHNTNGLLCHHCGSSQFVPKSCKKCHSTSLTPVGAGTQRVYQYLKKKFPETAIVRVDRDEVRKKNELDRILEQIKGHEIQLIIGTQMLAKGHDFPNLSLVVVVDVDSGFYNQDYRAFEQLGQLLTQVAGRAGRAAHQGEVYIQTFLPQHPLLNLLIQQGYHVFAKQLLLSRKQALFPPYQFLAIIRAEDKKKEKVACLLATIKQYLADYSLEILGPAPAPLARKAHFHRMQLVIKSANRILLQQVLTIMRAWLATNKLTNNIRWSIDVDPQDLS